MAIRVAPSGGGAAPKITVAAAPVVHGTARLAGAPVPSGAPLRVAPKVAVVAPGASRVALGRGLVPGAIKAPYNAGVARVISTLGNQIIHLPETTLNGAVQLGLPLVRGFGDVVSGHEGAAVHQGKLEVKGLKAAATSDPFYQAITTGSAAPFAKNPLGTALDLTGIYDLAGRGLGATMRSGALGEDAARAAAVTGRAPREVLPGAEGTAIPRTYSHNYFTKLIQQHTDALEPGSGKLSVAKLHHDLRQQVAFQHAANQGELANEESHIMKSLNGAKPKGKEEAAVAPIVAMTGMGREGIYRLYNEVSKGEIPRDPEAADSRMRLLQDLHAAILKDHAGKFDWPSTYRAAAGYKPLAALQETQKAVLGQHDVAQLARHLDNLRALREADVHYLKGAVKDPRGFSLLKDAADEVRLQRGNLKTAQQEQAANAVAHQRVGAHITSTIKRLPVNYVNDRLLNHLLDEQQMVADSRAETFPAHAERVAHYEGRLKDALKAQRDAVKAAKKMRLQGTVIEDPTLPPMRSGPLKGLSVRPLTADDAAAIRAGERILPTGEHVRVAAPDAVPDLQSYVSTRNPDRVAAQSVHQALRTKRGDQIVSMAERGNEPFTGESLHVGDIRSGWSSLPNTLLANARQLSEDRETQAFIKRFEVPNVGKHGVHEPFPTLADAKLAARDYEAAHGVKLAQIVDKNGVIHNIPEAAVKELNRQRALDHPSTAGRLITVPNKVFRETVLPYSPKLPVMHTVENTTRTLLNEHGNPLRALNDYKLQRAVEGKMAPGAQARLGALATPGAMSRSGVAGEAEDLGKLVTEDTPKAKSAIQKTVHFMSGVSTTIIRGQRWMEKAAQRAALGAHERGLLADFGVSFRQARAEMDTYAQKLADHLATPQDAERAARAVQDTVGKYNAFTANARLALRVMPFGAWYLNAAKLIFVTLPRDHPLFDSLLQSANNANAQQLAAQHAGLPNDLQTAIPEGPNEYLDIGKLTPIGLPNQAPETTAAQLVLPEFTGAGAAAMGKDPFWADLYGPNTPYGKGASPNGLLSPTAGQRMQAISSMIEQGLESMGGPLSDVSRAIYGHGGRMYNISEPVLHLLSGGQLGAVALKPGSTADKPGPLGSLVGNAVDKVVDPFRPIHIVPKNGALLNAKGVLGKNIGVVGKLPNSAIGRAATVEGK